jgi:hypothetical protein
MLAGGDSALNTLKTVEDLKRPNLASFFRFLDDRKIDQIADITREHVEDWIEAVGGALFDEFPYQGRLRRRMRLIHKRSRQG